MRYLRHLQHLAIVLNAEAGRRPPLPRATGDAGRHRRRTVVLAFAAATLVAAPAAQAGPALIAPVEAREPLLYPAGQQGRPTFLQAVKSRFDADIVGELQSGWFCSRRGDVLWNQSTGNALLPKPMVVARFRDELERAHYPVPVRSDALFEEKKDGEGAASAVGDRRQEPLRVGVFIKEISTNICSKGGNGSSAWTGGAHLTLFWQVFAPEQQKVIFETTTEGGFQTADAAPKSAPSGIVVAAFEVGVRNLLADPKFALAVSSPTRRDGAAAAAGGASGAAAVGPLAISGASATEEPLARHVTQLRSAVATVVGETGSGSGFFVGRNGLLLTNQHVVGNARFVKVRLVTGRDLVGEVLRTDAARDVALVKTEPAGIDPMPVRLSEPAVGDEVYALGSPLGDAFNTTLTKGILSGFRELNGQSFLQSDVAILPGNSGGPLLDKSGQVIGITVMGLGARGLAGMNFFVPVANALDKLQLTIAPTN